MNEPECSWFIIIIIIIIVDCDISFLRNHSQLIAPDQTGVDLSLGLFSWSLVRNPCYSIIIDNQTCIISLSVLLCKGQRGTVQYVIQFIIK